jgi:hypothetical protein
LNNTNTGMEQVKWSSITWPLQHKMQDAAHMC